MVGKVAVVAGTVDPVVVVAVVAGIVPVGIALVVVVSGIASTSGKQALRFLG